MEAIEQLRRMAAALTANPATQQQLVKAMARYLVQRQPHTANTNGHASQPGQHIQRDLWTPFFYRLSPRQQQVLHTLLAGNGVRATANLLGVSHVAILQHRRRILHTLQKFLDAPPPPPGLPLPATATTTPRHPFNKPPEPVRSPALSQILAALLTLLAATHGWATP